MITFQTYHVDMQRQVTQHINRLWSWLDPITVSAPDLLTFLIKFNIMILEFCLKNTRDKEKRNTYTHKKKAVSLVINISPGILSRRMTLAPCVGRWSSKRLLACSNRLNRVRPICSQIRNALKQYVFKTHVYKAARACEQPRMKCLKINSHDATPTHQIHITMIRNHKSTSQLKFTQQSNPQHWPQCWIKMWRIQHSHQSTKRTIKQSLTVTIECPLMNKLPALVNQTLLVLGDIRQVHQRILQWNHGGTQSYIQRNRATIHPLTCTKALSEATFFLLSSAPASASPSGPSSISLHQTYSNAIESFLYHAHLKNVKALA